MEQDPADKAPEPDEAWALAAPEAAGKAARPVEEPAAVADKAPDRAQAPDAGRGGRPSLD